MGSPRISDQESRPLEGFLDLVNRRLRSEAAAIGVVPVIAANVSTAPRSAFLEDVTLTSFRFSMTTIARAAGKSFSQVLLTFMM